MGFGTMELNMDWAHDPRPHIGEPLGLPRALTHAVYAIAVPLT